MKRVNDWVSSKGARSIQFQKIKTTPQGKNAPDSVHMDVITLKQSCLESMISLSIERRYQDKDGVFVFAGNPYAGISLEPSEWQDLIRAMKELER